MRLSQSEIIKVHGAVADVVIDQTTATRASYHVGSKPSDFEGESNWIRIVGLIEAKLKAEIKYASRIHLGVSFAEETYNLSFNDIAADIIVLIESSVSTLNGVKE